MHTLLVIVGFFIIIFAPVLAAQASRVKRKRKLDSSALAGMRVANPVPPVSTQHLRPRPRHRKSL